MSLHFCLVTSWHRCRIASLVGCFSLAAAVGGCGGDGDGDGAPAGPSSGATNTTSGSSSFDTTNTSTTSGVTSDSTATTGGTTASTSTTGSTTSAAATSTTGGAGGASSATNTTSGGTTGGTTTCTFSVNHELSSAIGTVGIVTWSSDLPGIDEAHIEFGLSEVGFTMQAPVDLTQQDYRTLLLGMKGERDYSFRIVASAGGQSCTSETYTLTTQPVDNDVPQLEREVMNESAVAPGFMLTASGLGNGPGGGGTSMAFILDSEGDVVWWSEAPGGTGPARMNWEGTDMWMMSVNNGGGSGEVRRVSMDGLDVETNVAGLEEGHHDFTVMPGGIIVAIVHLPGGGGGGCSAIVQRTPDGTITDIVADVSTLYEPVNDCHPNAIHYHPSDDSFTVSDRNPNLFVKFTRSGTLQWQFGGSNPLGPHIPGAWNVNHGHHLLPNGNFLFFNNGAGNSGSAVLEFALDLEGLTAQEVWSYVSEAGSGTLGDVQRLPNGNTLVTYSNQGVMHEVDSEGNLVQTLSTDSLGYTMHRPTLYGPPPR